MQRLILFLLALERLFSKKKKKKKQVPTHITYMYFRTALKSHSGHKAESTYVYLHKKCFRLKQGFKGAPALELFKSFLLHCEFFGPLEFQVGRLKYSDSYFSEIKIGGNFFKECIQCLNCSLMLEFRLLTHASIHISFKIWDGIARPQSF